MLRYLSGLNSARVILWCYFSWWLTTAARCFDPSPRLWLTSIGLSGIIGFGLYLSTTQGSGSQRTKLGPWQIFRLFLMPFCVSSFAALIKGKGYILIFSPLLEDNLQSGLVCVAIVALVRIAKRIKNTALPPPMVSAPAMPGSSRD